MAINAPVLETAGVSQDQGYSKGLTITHGSLRRGLWKVSWPVLLTASCLSVVDLVHVQCAGTLSTGSQAIIGVCDQIMLVCAIVITSLSTAGTALISKAYGARSTKMVAVMNWQMLALLGTAATVMSVLILALSKSLLSTFSGCVSNCNATIHDGESYLGVVAFFLIPFAVVSAINATFIGTGNARVQLITLSLMTIVDVSLCYFLVIKDWPVSGMGITGIAAASITGYGVAAIAAGLAWWKSDIRGKCKSENTEKNPSAPFVRPLLVAGIPTALQEIAWCSSTFVLFWILSLLSEPSEAVAAWTVGQRLEAFALLPLSAMSMSVLVAVGQNLGSSRVERAWKSVTVVTAIAVALLVIAGVALFSLAEPLARGATTDETTRKILVCYLRLAAFGLPFAALETILSAALQAMNDTRVPMVFSFISNWIFGLGLTYLLAITFGNGSNGAWLAMVLTTGVLGILVAARFVTRGEWRGLSPFAKSNKPKDAEYPQTMDQAECSNEKFDGNDKTVARGKNVLEFELPAKDSFDGPEIFGSSAEHSETS